MGDARAPETAAVLTPRAPHTVVWELFQESWKYLLVSIVALGVDTGLNFLLKYAAHAPWQIAVAGGFVAGVMVNYGLSIRFVFHQHRLGNRLAEFLGFLIIGVGGLLVKEAATWLFYEGVRLDYKIATGLAVGVAFFFNFGVRRALLFSAKAPSRKMASS